MQFTHTCVLHHIAALRFLCICTTPGLVLLLTGGWSLQALRRFSHLLNGLPLHVSNPPAGSGADEDIVVSSARAYTGALNKMIGWLSASSAKSAEIGSRPRPTQTPATASV